MSNLAIKVVRRLYDLGVRVPAGLGKPVPADVWNRDFASGQWDHLGSISELSRYAVIASYVARIHPECEILDVGCGAGVMRSFFEGVKFLSYTGIDISEEAVRQANQKNFDQTRFVVGDFDKVLPTGHFEVIIFNESIGYAQNPASTFQRYWHTLDPEGLMVISMFHTGVRSLSMWRNIEAKESAQYAIRLINEKQQMWDVKMFRKT